MNEPDELDLPDPAEMRGVGDSEEIPLPTRIARLVRERPYGVLCTQSESQPYGSLVALAATEDLTTFVFPHRSPRGSIVCSPSVTMWPLCLTADLARRPN